MRTLDVFNTSGQLINQIPIVHTYDTSIEQTLKDFFPDSNTRTMAYKCIKDTEIQPTKAYRHENQNRGLPAKVYLTNDLQLIKSQLDEEESKILRKVPDGCLSYNQIIERYDLNLNQVMLLFKLVELEAEPVRYYPKGSRRSAKVFKEEKVKTVMDGLAYIKHIVADQPNDKENLKWENLK